MPRKRSGRIDKHGHSWRLQVWVDGQRVRKSYSTYEEAEAGLQDILYSVEAREGIDLAQKLGSYKWPT